MTFQTNGAGEIVHAEADQAIWLHRVATAHGLNAASPSTESSGLVVHVPDVDAHFASVRAAGATILSEPRDQEYGQRQYGARDPDGHQWWFDTPKA